MSDKENKAVIDVKPVLVEEKFNTPPRSSSTIWGTWTAGLVAVVFILMIFPSQEWTPSLIAIVVFSTAFLLAFLLPECIRHTEALFWIEPLIPEITNKPDVKKFEGLDSHKVRLSDQVDSIIGRANHHMRVMMYFYSNYYVSILLRAVFGGLAAIAMTLVSKKGWGDASPSLLSFFLSTSVCTIFFFAFPNMFKQEENVAKNKALYLKYLALLNEVRTFVATAGCVPDGSKAEPMTMLKLIKRLDDELLKANDIVVSFDPGKFPVYKLSVDK